MGGAVSLGDILGVRVRASGLWLVAFALAVAALATNWFPLAAPGAGVATYVGLGVVGAVLLFLSVGMHELAHVLYADYRGEDVTRVTLYPFGGVSDLDDELRSPSDEFQLAVVGPLANFILAGLATLLQSAFFGQNELAVALFGFLDRANVILGLLNLLPAYPLDGGRLLRALLWNGTQDAAKATRVALLIGQVIAYLLMLVGIVQFFVGGPDAAGSALWLAFIGVFLLVAGRSSSRRAMVDDLFAGVTVSELMRPAPPYAAASATLQQVVDEHLLSGDGAAVPVLKTGRFVGLITLADVRAVPRDRWATTPASAAMTPLDRLSVTTPRELVRDVVPLVAESDVRQMPVLQDEKLVGMLGRDALMGYMEQRRISSTEAVERVATPATPAS
ncbi:MAG TPA: site-2 protease family protein [Ktedonobacterales bacterium]